MGFAWADLGSDYQGLDGGTGFAHIAQFETCRVVMMAETAAAGTKAFVGVFGSTAGKYSDTSYMSALNIYTNGWLSALDSVKSANVVATSVVTAPIIVLNGIRCSLAIEADTSSLYIYTRGKKAAIPLVSP